MLVDFRDASERHWDDAGHLFTHTRLANADHLFGLAAECALKAVMLALGMNLRSNGKPEDPYAVHINLLWDEFITFARGRGGAHYVAMLSGGQNPFDDWHVSQRYDHRTQFRQTVVENHRQASKETVRVLEAAVLNGDVS